MNVANTASARVSDMLRVTGLRAGYGKHTILDRLDLPALEPGKVHALLGPNAAGKSTLLRALAGLVPASGQVLLGDLELSRLSLADRARHVTYMPQALPQGVALSVLESVVSARRAGHDAAGMRAARGQAAAMLERIGMLPLALTNLNALSGGQRQLASLAQALIRKPRVLLLDEPISALDLHHQYRVMQLVHELARERGMIVLVVLHDLQIAARWCDGIVMLADGAIVAAGAPEQAITTASLARVYGVKARVEHCSHGTLQVMVDDLAVPEAAP